MLWIGLHLPFLSLESCAAGLPHAARAEPLALIEGHAIAHANAAARHLGVRSGMKRATALALAPQLRLVQADAARDAQALAAVAYAALAFTPAVSLEPPQAVLLEVQASLRCFGGLERLQQRLQDALAPLRHRVCLASAPTAQGAALLARRASPKAPLHCADLVALHRSLDPAPVGLLASGQAHREALQGMGLRTLAELRRMPRAGLARRFGEALLDELDRARGELPDPRDWVTLPPAFDSRLELFARADTTDQVLHGAGVLLARLVAWAAARHARVRGFTLLMHHEPHHRPGPDGSEAPAHTRLDIALAEPSRDAAHLGSLLRERLARIRLAAATLELQLRCADIARSASPNSELFPTPRSEREGLVRLIERLQARLGPEQVRRLARVQDHRPEQASVVLTQAASAVPAAASRPAALPPRAAAPRPVWLLRVPQALSERRHQPLLDGTPLRLLCGPERIESGWWDGALAERDYFIAQAGDGTLVWVFRGRWLLSSEGREEGWYLQGRFA